MFFPFSNQQHISSTIMIETILEATLSAVAAWPKKIQMTFSATLSPLSQKFNTKTPAVLSS
jgi:hypothetical protein